MPLSEFHSVMKSKHDSGQQKMANCSPAQASFVPDHELVELLWENGHVVMQGQSNRPKKNSFPSAFPSFAGKTKEKETGDAVILKATRYGAADALGSDLHTSGPLGQVGLGGQDDELVPWLNCPIDGAIDDYCSEFLSEFSGVNPNSLLTTVPTDRPSSFGQAARDAHGLENGNGSRAPVGSSEPSRMNSSQLFQFPQQYHTLSTGSRQKEPDVAMGTAHLGPRGDLPATRLHKQDLTTSKLMQPNSSNAPVMNFSHFSRPVALVKANLLGVDRVRGSEKASTAASSNPMESTLVESATALKSVSALHGRLASVAAKADLNPPVQPSQELAFVGHSEAICLEDAAKSSGNHKKTDGSSNRRTPDHMKCQDSKLKTIGQHETENRHEPAIASSSVCSANGAGAASNDIKNSEKRKSQEGEESEYPSEDQEDDSTDVRKQSMGKKRSRAAEVHNLSERRRRDRINEKMRALQELIPNCNKVDKASMLDEAIEYLKTLQMQVQIMSMGSGLCVPPMMLSAGVQHIRAPHMGPFSPMGMGMGMGMGLGFGMGLFDMTRSPLIPITRMHGPQYPCASIPGTAGPHGMPGSASPQMFGIPGQALPMPMSMPHPPPFTPLTGMTANVNPVPEEPAAELSPLQVSDSAPPSSKDQQLNTLGQVTKTSTDNIPAESSRQASKECFELPSIVQIDNEPPNGCGCEATISRGGGIRLRP